MSSNDSGSNRQGELFPRSRQMTVTVAPDRARFHAIARGSAMECGAVLVFLMKLADYGVPTFQLSEAELIEDAAQAEAAARA
jgi:hypothetical protein